MKTFKDFKPIALSYQQLSASELKVSNLSLNNGLEVKLYDVLSNYNDVNLNNDTCLALTDQKQIGDVFVYRQSKIKLGYIPTDIYLRPTQLQNTFLYYDVAGNTFKCDNTYTSFNITRTQRNDDSVHLMCENSYVCVDESYPFTVRLKNKSEIQYIDSNQYTFYVNEIGDAYSFRVVVANVSRYLGIGANNNLLATGMYLGDVYNYHYLFHANILSTRTLTFDPIVSNKWVTYYMDLNNREHNNDVIINKTLETKNNYLLNFKIDQSLIDSQATVNISNLKTNFTPTGVGTSVNNLVIDVSSVLNIVNDPNTSLLTTHGVVTFTLDAIKIY